MKRRSFLCAAPLVCAGGSLFVLRQASAAANAVAKTDSSPNPSKQTLVLPKDFSSRVGAAHAGGRYYLTSKPFLLEGAEKLLELGTRLGKFWLTPRSAKANYRWNSDWPECKSLLELAKTEYYQELFKLPFQTLVLVSHGCSERGEWRTPDAASHLDEIQGEHQQLACYLFRKFSDREITIVLQNWEGDWILRGKAGDPWHEVPAEAPHLCERMAEWFARRQRAVTEARKQFPHALCRVLNAVEVNRVRDGVRGIPTVTHNVLPKIAVDLVSHSAYEAMDDGPTLRETLSEIQAHARYTGVLEGKPLMIGEIGIPENGSPERVTARWEELLRAALEHNVRWIVQWQLYCNEPAVKPDPTPEMAVRQNDKVRGFYLVKPDGALSETGRYLSKLWTRANQNAGNPVAGVR